MSRAVGSSTTKLQKNLATFLPTPRRAGLRDTADAGCLQPPMHSLFSRSLLNLSVSVRGARPSSLLGGSCAVSSFFASCLCAVGNEVIWPGFCFYIRITTLAPPSTYISSCTNTSAHRLSNSVLHQRAVDTLRKTLLETKTIKHLLLFLKTFPCSHWK